jgi:hypothetical protein
MGRGLAQPVPDAAVDRQVDHPIIFERNVFA